MRPQRGFEVDPKSLRFVVFRSSRVFGHLSSSSSSVKSEEVSRPSNAGLRPGERTKRRTGKRKTSRVKDPADSGIWLPCRSPSDEGNDGDGDDDGHDGRVDDDDDDNGAKGPEGLTL